MKTAPYLFVCNENAALVEIPDGFSSDAWGNAQRRFAKLVAPRQDPNQTWVDCHRLWAEQRRGPVYWSEELAGSSGMSFTLLPMPEAEKADIAACASHLRGSRDVVRLLVQRIHRWRDFDPIA